MEGKQKYGKMQENDVQRRKWEKVGKQRRKDYKNAGNESKSMGKCRIEITGYGIKTMGTCLRFRNYFKRVAMFRLWTGTRCLVGVVLCNHLVYSKSVPNNCIVGLFFFLWFQLQGKKCLKSVHSDPPFF